MAVLLRFGWQLDDDRQLSLNTEAASQRLATDLPAAAVLARLPSNKMLCYFPHLQVQSLQ
jgi:hypothetical protein